MRQVLLILLMIALLGSATAQAAPLPQADNDPPGVEQRYPAPGQTRVSLDDTSKPFLIRVRFDELMDQASITNASMRLRAQGESQDVPLEITAIGPAAGAPSKTEVVWETVPRSIPTNPFAWNRVIFGGITYTATLSGQVRDLAGNPLGADVSWQFTTHPDYVGDSNQPHFLAAESIPSCMVLLNGPELGGGVLASDLLLRGRFAEDFSGPSLPAGWTGSGISFSGSALRINGGQAAGEGQRLAVGESLFVFAMLGGQAGQMLGLQQNSDPANPGQYARLEVRSGGLYARTQFNASLAMEHGPLVVGGSNFASGAYRFAIHTGPGEVVYEAYINGDTRIELARHNINLSMALAPVFVDPAGAPALVVPWLNVLSPAASPPCSFTSRVLRADRLASWHELFWMGSRSGTTFETRSGSSPTPGADWSSWQPLQAGTDAVLSPQNVYLQYRLTFTPSGTNPRWLENTWIEYTGSGPVLTGMQFYLPMVSR